ncbi:MAG: peptide ABC transporter substrate-binding protein [Anaerolineae bacterium]
MKRVLVLLAATLLLVLAVAPIAAQDTGTIHWSFEGISDVASFDPAKVSDAPVFNLVSLVYGGLVKLNADLLVEPDLAESWTISDDGLTYTFTLRDGIAFSDGTPITSADVVWSLNHALDPNTGGWSGSYFLGNIVGAAEMQAGTATELSGVTALDEKTVQIQLNQPSAYFLSQLTVGPGKVVSSAQAAADPEGWELAPVSSGPFVVAEHNPGQVLLAPNPGYWQVPSVSLNVSFNQDSETAYQLFRTGALDIMGSSQAPVPAARVAEVQGTPEFHSIPAWNMRYVAFNNEIAPFDDVRVRQAFAYATDRATLADVVLSGTVTASDRILPGGFPGSELPIEGIPYDPAAGVALLQEAGIDPASINLTLTYGVEGDNERVATVLQSMWQEGLGVTVTLEPLELSTFSDRLNTTFVDPTNGLQAYYSIWGADYPDPQNFISQQLRTGVGNNNSHYSNAEFDALVDQADASGVWEERAPLYNQAEQLAVTEVGWLPLFSGQVNVLIRDCVKGVELMGLFYSFVIPDFASLEACPAS